MSRVARRKEKKKRFRKRVIASIIAAIVLIYAGGAAFFYSHCFPNTKVGDINIGFRSKASAKNHMNDLLSTYSLKIVGGEKEDKLLASEVGLYYSNLDDIDQVIDDQSFLTWFIEVPKKHTFDRLNVKLDSNQLGHAVDQLNCMSPELPTASTDAYITYSDKKGKYIIKPETIGNMLDKEHFMEGATESLCGLRKKISLEDKSYYIQPNVFAEDQSITDAQKTLNKYLKSTINYKDGNLKTTFSKKNIVSCLSWDDNFAIKISKDKIKKFVKDNVSKTYNSLSGEIPAGLTAWKVSVDKETDQIVKDIKAGKAKTRKPIYAKEGFNRDSQNVGKTYIDINISDQHLWYVESGSIQLESDVVTGNISTGHGSPTGFYRIAWKTTNYTMVKYNAFVNYWMPYDTANGIGLHDATWRGAFGGSIYRTDGSHGCINMPLSKARSLYYMIGSGTPVYVHW